MNITESTKVFLQYRFLLKALVTRDLKVKYRRSILGYLWSLLNPLFMMVVMTVVFSNFFRFDLPNYPLYLIIGQVVFSFAAESTTMAMSSILDNAALLKKVYVPKFIFPVARAASSFVTMLFSLVAIVIVMLATNVPLQPTMLLLPIPLFFLFVFCLGLGLILSALAVYFRDMFHLYSVFVTAWSFWTPIFYPIKIIPEEYRAYLVYNPLLHILNYFRDILLYDKIPGVSDTLLCCEISFGALILGLIVFKRLQKQFLLYV